MIGSELRIGNWLQRSARITPHKFFIVESIGPYGSLNERGTSYESVYYEYPSDDEWGPIPLTEEIMLKCGFEYIDKGYSKTLKMFRNGILYFEIYKGKITWSGLNLKEDDERIEIQYLHELQNVYYWLSGKKELEVKL